MMSPDVDSQYLSHQYQKVFLLLNLILAMILMHLFALL